LLKEYGVDFSPGGAGRMVVALAIIGLMAVSAWFTMDAGKYRNLTFVLLAFFAIRVVLGRLRTR
jgi:hypothetical protein